jgi:TRAP-type C4-dicarboxylate transport system substrate-binding protein
MLEEWGRRIEAQSDGRIQVDVYPAMQLGGQPPALIDQVRDGIVDVVWTLPGYTPGRFPRVEAFELPFINRHPVVVNHALTDFVANHPEEFPDIKVIGVFVHAGQALHSKVPIRSVADFEGLKIRIPTRISGWLVEALGATPIGIPVAKIPELLSKGIVDATLIPYEATFPFKVHELVDYHVTLDRPDSDRFNTQVLIIAMNPDTYNSLPADLQAVIDANAGKNISTWLGELWLSFETRGEEAARASGEIIVLPSEQIDRIREIAEGYVIDQWVRAIAKKDIDGRALLEEARALLDHYDREFDAGNL